MKPNDDNGTLSTTKRPFRVLIISGSKRRQYHCPGVDSKSRALMLRMAERLPPEWEIDYEDPGNVYRRERIQSVMRAFQNRWLCVFGGCLGSYWSGELVWAHFQPQAGV